jgi:hypothetical protein
MCARMAAYELTAAAEPLSKPYLRLTPTNKSASWRYWNSLAAVARAVPALDRRALASQSAGNRLCDVPNAGTKVGNIPNWAIDNKRIR